MVEDRLGKTRSAVVTAIRICFIISRIISRCPPELLLSGTKIYDGPFTLACAAAACIKVRPDPALGLSMWPTFGRPHLAHSRHYGDLSEYPLTTQFANRSQWNRFKRVSCVGRIASQRARARSGA